MEASLTTEQVTAYKQFAYTNRSRGRDFISQIRGELSLDLQGKWILDIGCAYGGFVIEAAKEGAYACGIEILNDLFGLAEVNIENEEGVIDIRLGNILDDKLVFEQKFDLIIINDVFEHIFDIELLFQRIEQLSSEDTVVYFSIPNGDSYHSISKEGHRFMFGLSLLEPGYWGALVGEFNIYYRPIDIYRYYFCKAGFKYLYVHCENSKHPGAADRIKNKLEEFDEKLDNNFFANSTINAHARERLRLLKQKLQRDLSISPPELIHINSSF